MYVIKQTREFYGPRTERSLVLGEDFMALTFATRKAAKAWIAEAYGERYYQAHNEYGRPDYKVIALNRLAACYSSYL